MKIFRLLLYLIAISNYSFPQSFPPSEFYLGENYIFQDATEKYSFDKISSAEFENNFKKVSYDNIAARTNAVNWIRFQLKNDTKEKLFLAISGLYSKIDFYSPIDSLHWKNEKAGFSYPFRDRKYKYSEVLFEVPSSPKVLTCYLRIETQISIALVFQIQDSSIFQDDYRNDRLHLIICALIFTGFAFSLILFFILKEKVYLYYACYALSFCIYALFFNGLINRFINFPFFSVNIYTYAVPFTLSTVFLLLYSRSFLELKETYPVMNKLILTAIGFKFILLFLPYFTSSDSLNPLYDNIILILPLVGAALRLKDGFKPARYFIVGYTVFFIGFVSHTITHFHILIPEIFSIFNFGLIEMLFFAIALTDKFNFLKKEDQRKQQEVIKFQKESLFLQEGMIDQLKINEELKDKVNKELEDRIEERTIEIKRQADEIERMNLLLRDDNQKLETTNKVLKTERILQKAVSFEEFIQMYPDEDTCYKFLYDLKWKNGFVCKRCQNTKYSVGNMPYSCKCSKCRYIETATVDTIFGNVRFSLVKAFYILVYVYSHNKINTTYLVEILELRRQTGFNYIEKVKAVITKNKSKTRYKEGWIDLILDK